MPRTILLFLFGDLGDTILTTPAVRALRSRYPDARLVLVGKPAAARFLAELQLIDGAIEVDKHLFDRVWSLANPTALLRLVTLLRRIRKEHADVAVVFHHLVTRWGALKFALLALASGAHSRAGLDNGRGWFLTDTVRDLGFGARHEAEYWRDVAGLLDARDSLRLEVPMSADDHSFARDFLDTGAGGPSRFLAIHAGTGWYGPGRRWPADRFATAAERLLEADPRLHVLVVGTEDDRVASMPLLKSLGARATDLLGQTTVGQLAAILSRCRLLLANDGGVAHLAAASGVPVVAVFGPSNDAAWRPLGSTVVAADLPCRPCFYRDFERGLPAGCATRECLALVTPESVAAAAMAILAGEALAV